MEPFEFLGKHGSRSSMVRYLTRLVPMALGIACASASDTRLISGFHEIGTFRPSNMHSLYPTVTHFVVAPESVMGDRKVVLAYSRRTCADELVCFVLFWTNESKAARSFGITDSEARAMVASYTRNRSSGSEGFKCYNFGLPAEHCARP